jgi:hypothetical protein
MTKKQCKPAGPIEIKPIDVLATLLAEIAEAVELMSPHFSNEEEDALRARAQACLRERYALGHWPDFKAVAEATRLASKEPESDLGAHDDEEPIWPADPTSEEQLDRERDKATRRPITKEAV